MVPRPRSLLLMIVTVLACAYPAAAHAVTFGASVDGDFSYYARGEWTWSEVQTSLQALRATGATVAQTGSDWSYTERRRPRHGHHRYDWSRDDTIVSGLARADLRWQPSLDYTPTWAQQHIKPARQRGLVSPLPPANDGVYAAYVAAFARRYGIDGTFWQTHQTLPFEPVTTFEIWNEPDCRWTWGPDVDLADYAHLYRAAYRAIKAVDPRASVVTGGLAFTYSSLDRMLRAMKGFPIDGIAVHPYGPNAGATIRVVTWTAKETERFGRGRDAADRQRVRLELGSPQLAVGPEPRAGARRAAIDRRPVGDPPGQAGDPVRVGRPPVGA